MIVSCEYDHLNGWNSTLQAAWYIRHVRIIWFLWTKPTIWLILSFTQNIVRACSMFYPYEGCRSVTPLDAARVNRTIFRNYSVHWYYITLKNWKTSAVSTTDGWLKLNFASCVIRQTRSLGVLVLCSNWNIVFVNWSYDMVVDTQFHKFYGTPFAGVLYVFLM